jgi:RNA polymerase sigma-70 factor (ECF subfamily)
MAEDISSDVFNAAYNAFDHFDPSRATISTWLYTIVNNRLKNYYRDNKNEISIEATNLLNCVATSPEMEQAIYIEQCRDVLKLALEKLSPRERKIVTLKYFKFYNTREIADKMKISNQNVRVILYRSLAKLQKILAKNHVLEYEVSDD